MFGVSLAKILLLAAVVAAVWFGFKYLTRQPAAPGPGVRAKADDAAGRVEDMVRCPVCGAFQARAAGPCARPDCPARS
jgi:uncharacterized protein